LNSLVPPRHYSNPLYWIRKLLFKIFRIYYLVYMVVYILLVGYTSYNIIHLTYSSCTIVFCSGAFMGWKSGGVVVSHSKNLLQIRHCIAAWLPRYNRNNNIVFIFYSFLSPNCVRKYHLYNIMAYLRALHETRKKSLGKK